MRLALVLALVLMMSIPGAKSAELWDFIRVGKNLASGPKWEPRSGKAEVEFKGDQIEIRVSYTDDLESGAPNKLGHESIRISGTLGPNGSVRATCIFLGTDRKPFKLTGQLILRDELQIWGEKRKIVTQKELVFSHPPNFEFFGFLGKEARDE
jgi:hypothetical protein